MARIGAIALLLGVVGVTAIHPSTVSAQSADTALKHYRLTFAVTYAHNEQPSQSLVLDVPVAPNKPGTSGMSMVSGLAGQSDGSVEESLQCTEVQESATGLSAKVAFAVHGVSDENQPEPIHRQLNFNRQIDVVIGKPTRITEEMHLTGLGKGNEAAANALPAAPVITVTATEL